MPDFRVRSTEPEWMDGAEVSEAEFAACVTDLAIVNSVTFARPPTMAFVAEAVKRAQGRPLTLLDVGFGAGDMLRAIHRFCARRGAPVRLIGIDLNPRSLSVARAATPPDMVIDYRIGDLYRLPREEEIDLVVSSLVTHHMQDEEIVRFLRWMTARARTGWFVNDLHRHPVAYHGFRLLSAAMRWHPFVRHDGPLSVARAFHREDWERLIGAAGLTDGTALRWHFPFRYCVTHWT